MGRKTIRFHGMERKGEKESCGDCGCRQRGQEKKGKEIESLAACDSLLGRPSRWHQCPKCLTERPGEGRSVVCITIRQ